MQSMEHTYYVYIITNKDNRVLYTGVTNNLTKRLYEHRNGLTPGFASKYQCHKLVWYEATSSIIDAISYEKKIKSGSRSKKIHLIETVNSQWKDLSEEWV